jgi:hypothetical protein
MKRLVILIMFATVSVAAFAQKDGGKNLLEYTLQIKETKDGTAVIVGGNDFISKDYYKTRIDIGKIETVDGAIARLSKLHFKVKSTTSVNGRQIVTMSVDVDPKSMESCVNDMLKIADKLDKICSESVKVEWK